MWYGLYINDELKHVAWFNSDPTLFEFNVPLFTWNEYEIFPVNVSLY